MNRSILKLGIIVLISYIAFYETIINNLADHTILQNKNE
jgi:hypothetical protein